MDGFHSEFSRRQLLAAGAALPLAWADLPRSCRGGGAAAGKPPTQVKPDYTLDVAAKSIAPLGKPSDATLVNGLLPGSDDSLPRGRHVSRHGEQSPRRADVRSTGMA